MKKSKTRIVYIKSKALALFCFLVFLFPAENASAQDSLWMKVSVSQQKLFLMNKLDTLRSYDISTSKYGLGSESGSHKTPLGLHRVVEKYGDSAPEGTIFKSRINTGRIAEIEMRPQTTKLDYVTTRILWLDGMEPGKNKGGNVDSYHRYIYIHGTHEEGLIGRPASKGCIRMRNNEVIELHELVPIGTTIRIDRE
jgi:lipoprotein-anchoring transpeptidase ErfK/SrfK